MKDEATYASVIAKLKGLTADAIRVNASAGMLADNLRGPGAPGKSREEGKEEPVGCFTNICEQLNHLSYLITETGRSVNEGLEAFKPLVGDLPANPEE